MNTLFDPPAGRGGELRFRLLGVLVRVKFWFWIAAFLMCGQRETGAVLIWVAVVFFSILAHEFGHVFAFRLFGARSDVILYGFGGVTIPDRVVHGTTARFLVAVAGPMAGFTVVAATVLLAQYAGAAIQIDRFLFLPRIVALPILSDGGFASLSQYHWYALINSLLFANFFWGLMNLLPIYPLDGGHAVRALLEQIDPAGGTRKSLILSIVTAGAVAVLGLLAGSFYTAILFGVLMILGFQALEAQRSARQ